MNSDGLSGAKNFTKAPCANKSKGRKKKGTHCGAGMIGCACRRDDSLPSAMMDRASNLPLSLSLGKGGGIRGPTERALGKEAVSQSAAAETEKKKRSAALLSPSRREKQRERERERAPGPEGVGRARARVAKPSTPTPHHCGTFSFGKTLDFGVGSHASATFS